MRSRSREKPVVNISVKCQRWERSQSRCLFVLIKTTLVNLYKQKEVAVGHLSRERIYCVYLTEPKINCLSNQWVRRGKELGNYRALGQKNLFTYVPSLGRLEVMWLVYYQWFPVPAFIPDVIIHLACTWWFSLRHISHPESISYDQESWVL